jgi:hypothetical protein
MPDTYSIRRSRFPAPPPAEIQDVEGMLAPEHLALLP